MGGGSIQGIGVYFQVPGNCQVLRAILIAKSKKEEKKRPENKKLFDLFSLIDRIAVTGY
jgi:hypothetical protein